MTEERKLVKKLAEIMNEVRRIPKNGFNNFNKYNYATESDVQDHVRAFLADRSIIMLSDVVEHDLREHKNRSGNTEYINMVRLAVTFMDGETGETITFHSVGEGQDSGDKGYYKAITGAQKYAIMKAFMIPTGDDPEQDKPQQKPQSKPQGQRQRSQGNSQPNSQKPAQKPQQSRRDMKEEQNTDAPKATAQQKNKLRADAKKLAEARNTQVAMVFQHLKIGDLEAITQAQATEALGTLEKWNEKANNSKEKQEA